jgi:hypothetical protein
VQGLRVVQEGIDVSLWRQILPHTVSGAVIEQQQPKQRLTHGKQHGQAKQQHRQPKQKQG